jgi:hypothetical protein
MIAPETLQMINHARTRSGRAIVQASFSPLERAAIPIGRDLYSMSDMSQWNVGRTHEKREGIEGDKGERDVCCRRPDTAYEREKGLFDLRSVVGTLSARTVSLTMVRGVRYSTLQKSITAGGCVRDPVGGTRFTSISHPFLPWDEASGFSSHDGT